MIIHANGRDYTPPELLMYWIQERYRIRTLKHANEPKPWTTDPVFQTTYFCNVHREDDKVTRFIRDFYSPYVADPMFVYNLVFARFINWPSTIKLVGYMREHTPRQLEDVLNFISDQGDKVWGNAYVITTHGQKMAKTKYLTEQVLTDVYKYEQAAQSVPAAHRPTPTCSGMSRALQLVDGIGSFLAAQVVADLKNTPGHLLYTAYDRTTFVEPGPGSIRGLNWFFGNEIGPSNVSTHFHMHFQMVREYADANWPAEVPPVDNQDLQNCLCEFDKYCRVATKSGRSKRKYNGG